jgi:hypothetical protein
MLQPRRYLAGALLVIPLFLAVRGFWWLVELALPQLGAIWEPDREALAYVSGKCAAARQANVPFGLIVGSSSAADSFWVSDLERESGLKWMCLAAAGGSLDRVLLSLDPYFASGLRPRVIILGLHPMLLKSPKRKPGSAVRLLLLTALEKVALKVRKGDIPSQTSPDPFADLAQSDRPFDQHYADVALEVWRSEGAFEPSTYRTDSREARVLQELLSKLQETTSSLIVLKAPEHPQLRTLVPPQADDVVNTLARGLPIHDLRDALPPEAFVDPVHKNDLGRRYLGPKIPEVLKN